MITKEELHDLILEDAQAKAYADAGNDEACAKRVSALLPKVTQETVLDYRGVAKQLGAELTRRFMVTVRAVASQDALVDEMQGYLRNGVGLDFGHTDTRNMLDTMASLGIQSGLTVQDAANIKALAEVSQTVTHKQVAIAWQQYRPDGQIQPPEE